MRTPQWYSTSPQPCCLLINCCIISGLQQEGFFTSDVQTNSNSPSAPAQLSSHNMHPGRRAQQTAHPAGIFQAKHVCAQPPAELSFTDLLYIAGNIIRSLHSSARLLQALHQPRAINSIASDSKATCTSCCPRLQMISQHMGWTDRLKATLQAGLCWAQLLLKSFSIFPAQQHRGPLSQETKLHLQFENSQVSAQFTQLINCLRAMRGAGNIFPQFHTTGKEKFCPYMATMKC